MTTLIPNKWGPFPAQSQLLPVPYSFPAITIMLSKPNYSQASKIGITGSSSFNLVKGPSSDISLFLILILANVPLIITSWFPLLEP